MAAAIVQNIIVQVMHMNKQIAQLPFWEQLSDSEKAFIEHNSIIRTFSKGAFLKGRNESCLGMVYVLSGAIRTLMISEEGREITLFRLYPGESAILSASCVLTQISYETEMIATEETQVLIVNSGAYAKLMEQNINVRCFSYELATERSSSVISVLQQIIFARFEQRLARFLLSTCEKTGNDSLTMTKEGIAREVNTAREVVSRMLKQFTDDGLIAMNQKTITILDKTGLQKLL